MLNMSITLVQEKCTNCGGPLRTTQPSLAVCPFCEAEFRRPCAAPYRIPTPLPRPTVDRIGRISLGSQDYLVHGRLAQGAHSDVFLARRDSALTEMVILKVARHDGAALTREWQVLTELHSRPDFLTALLATPVSQGMARCQGYQERTATVYRWRSGFEYTFEDARAEYPRGVDPSACVWMWNRLLDQLDCLHRRGYRHAAVKPQHLLLHPRDHGLALCGWCDCRTGSGATDLVASAECIAYLLGSGGPRPLRDLIGRAGKFADALLLKKELKRVAEEVFGPPRFRPFSLTNGGHHGIR